MACFKPLKGYRQPNGGITFNPKNGYVDQEVEVRCGRCIGCRIDYSRHWAVRCVHEAQMHLQNSFLTLTYSDEHLPPGGTLVKRDIQLFIKKLRKSIHPARISFFSCGEYGDNFHRPHYHLLIFGHWFPDAKPIPDKAKSGKKQFKSETLDKLWGKGFCRIGTVNYQSAAYCARYVMKKVNGQEAHDHYQKVDLETGEVIQLQPEFMLSSRNPAIGKTWFEKYQSDLYPHDYCVADGKEHSIPAYYDKLLKRKDPELHNTLKKERRVSLIDRKIIANNTEPRRAVREEVTNARTSLHKRNL